MTLLQSFGCGNFALCQGEEEAREARANTRLIGCLDLDESHFWQRRTHGSRITEVEAVSIFTSNSIETGALDLYARLGQSG